MIPYKENQILNNLCDGLTDIHRILELELEIGDELHFKIIAIKSEINLTIRKLSEIQFYCSGVENVVMIQSIIKIITDHILNIDAKQIKYAIIKTKIYPKQIPIIPGLNTLEKIITEESQPGNIIDFIINFNDNNERSVLRVKKRMANKFLINEKIILDIREVMQEIIKFFICNRNMNAEFSYEIN